MVVKHRDQQQFFADFLPLIAELECGQHYDEYNPQHVDWLKRRVATIYASGGTAICLYSDEGSPLGFLLLMHDPGLDGVRCFGKKATIMMFGLFSQYRSQGKGILLLEEAQRLVVQNGGECIYVDTYAANAGAIRYYSKNGFIPVAYHPGENGRGDHGQVYMYKDLA